MSTVATSDDSEYAGTVVVVVFIIYLSYFSSMVLLQLAYNIVAIYS